MGSGACEQRELMKLFKCVLDTGIEVLSACFTLKVLSLPQNKGNFTKFLENEKHFLYHQWEQKKTMCCACQTFGCSMRRIRKMETWIFEKLYEANGTEDPAHVIKRGGCIQQLCLHKFVTKNIAAHELDITVLSFLLRVFANMSVSENSSLDTVNFCRNSICHARSTNCFSMAELNTMWIDLEKHLINLSDVPYQRIIQKQIQSCRKHEIDKKEIAELSNRINSMEIVVDNLNHHFNNNHNTVPEFVKKFEKLYMNDSHQIQKNVYDQSRAIKQAQDTVVSVVKSEAQGVKEMHESILAKMEDQHGTTKEEMSKMRESQEELTQAVNKVLFKLKYDKPGKKNPSDKIVKECPVLWHLETPEEWNEKDVADALKDYERMSDEQDIKIKFVREGSLIILTTVPYRILHDKVNYEHAIKMFLTRMMDVCNIDTERACHVKATLHLLEHDEVNIQHSYVLFEDKSTQMSIPQADKCFQINSYECGELIDPEELELKSIFNIDDDNSDSRLYPRSGDENSYHNLSSSSISIPSLPVDDAMHCYSNPNIYSKASAWETSLRPLTRTNSACSLRSFDSSYGSHANSFAGSFRSIVGELTIPTSEFKKPSKALAGYHIPVPPGMGLKSKYDSSYLPGEWNELTPELKTSSQEQTTSSSASPYLTRKWKESTPEFKRFLEEQTLSASPYLPRKWKESTPEFKKSLEEQTTSSSASPYLPRKWKESTPEFKKSLEEITPMPIDAKEISSPGKKRKKSVKDKKCSIQ